MILVPTRELAVQVSDNLKTYARHLRINVTTLYGGAGMQPQINNLQRGVDVLVACPGRLLDHLERDHSAERPIAVSVRTRLPTSIAWRKTRASA